MGRVLSLKEKTIARDVERNQMKRVFVQSNFKLYSKIVEESSCYLSFEEIKIVAELVLSPKTKVLVFVKGYKEPVAIHPNGSETVLAIEYVHSHYSRIDKMMQE